MKSKQKEDRAPGFDFYCRESLELEAHQIERRAILLKVKTRNHHMAGTTTTRSGLLSEGFHKWKEELSHDGTHRHLAHLGYLRS